MLRGIESCENVELIALLRRGSKGRRRIQVTRDLIKRGAGVLAVGYSERRVGLKINIGPGMRYFLIDVGYCKRLKCQAKPM